MQTFPREPEDIEPVSTLWEDNCSFTTEDGAAELTQDQIARTLYVDAEGRMSPCIYLNLPVDAPASSPEAVNRRVFGSAVEEDPLGIWQSGPFRMFRDALQSPLPDIPCRTCPKRFETGN